MQNDGAKDLANPETGAIIDNAFDRALALVDRIDNLKGTVVLPAPVLSEYLLGVSREKHNAHLGIIMSTRSIQIAPFDELAAIECALLPSNQELKNMDANSTMAKLKYDRQIIAIALSIGADEIWTHDKQVFAKAKALGIQARSLADIERLPMQYSFPNPA